ncbi:MAG: DUF5776 domain-containing protein [Lentilactobacillus diolivorans]|uniref:DUF5776 domain-containing protein n=1 Tax=Lentilactobacillus diolivorans TaxID=179838 RepID=UPI0039EC7BC8
MMKISNILRITITAVTLLFAFSVTSQAADTTVDSNNPATVYQSKDDGSGWLNNKNYGALSPRVIQLKHQVNPKDNGKLLLTFEQVLTKNQGKIEHPVFPIYESDDNGASWKQISEVTETHNKDLGKMNCPQLYELPQTIGNMPKGTIVIAGDSTPNDLSKTEMELDKSTDAGQHWNYQGTIATGGINKTGEDPVWEPYLMVRDNKLVVYYSDERDNTIANGSQTIVHETSLDGINWSQPIIDVDYNKTDDPNSPQRPGMPILAQLNDGTWAMSYEHVQKGKSDISEIRITGDPENFNDSKMIQMVTQSGGNPYITALNNGNLAFNYGASGNVYVFEKPDLLNQGLGGATKTYPTQTGGAYNRQILPLANGRLLIANGGGFSSKPNSIRVETIDVGDTTQQGKVIVHYVDQNGKQLAPDDTVSGVIGTSFDVTGKTNKAISGYTPQGVTAGQNSLTGNFGADPIEITVTYTSVTSGGGSTVTTPSSSSSSSSSTVVSSSSSSTTSSTNESSSSTTSTEASTSKKVAPFKVVAKKALYRYSSPQFTKANRIKGYAQKTIIKAPVFKVVGTTKSTNGALRYRLSDGSYITAKKGYTTKLYLTKKVNTLKVINAKGTWEYKSTKAVKKNAVKHLKKGTVVTVKKIVKVGIATKYQLTNGHYVTGNRQYVKAQF